MEGTSIGLAKLWPITKSLVLVPFFPRTNDVPGLGSGAISSVSSEFVLTGGGGVTRLVRVGLPESGLPPGTGGGLFG